ncbi:MAG: MBL fold metallo-hydrolase [Proteobacteria bacterium]|nr:MBL fold metallo-hydrolase [Pseudomonadota bacterium]
MKNFKLNEVDALEVFVLMDNISDAFTSSHEGMRWNESQYRHGVRKKETVCGADLCRACNGLSLFIKIHHNSKIYTLLFDAGPDEGLVVDNAKRMGLDLTTVDAIVISHGHFDHFGGTLSVLDAISKKDLPVYIHPELLFPRGFKTKDSIIKDTNNLTIAKIEAHGGKVIEDKNPLKLFNGTLLISGEVPRHTAYETGFPNECRLNQDKWEASPEIIDERTIMLNLKNKGICVFTGCGHTGVVNAIEHAKQLLSSNKVHFVMGGFHLAGPTFVPRVNPTVTDLKKINPDYIITGHCTGRVAQTELTNAFSDRHIPYAVGTVFKFIS